MTHIQLDLLPHEVVANLLRKRKFWKSAMIISFIIGCALAMFTLRELALYLVRAFSDVEPNGAADPAELANEISTTLVVAIYSLPVAGLAWLISIVSLIRFFSVKKVCSYQNFQTAR